MSRVTPWAWASDVPATARRDRRRQEKGFMGWRVYQEETPHVTGLALLWYVRPPTYRKEGCRDDQQRSGNPPAPTGGGWRRRRQPRQGARSALWRADAGLRPQIRPARGASRQGDGGAP